MLNLPFEVVCCGILPYLSVSDLEILTGAYTTSKKLQSMLQRVLEAYKYESHSKETLTIQQLAWLHSVGVTIVDINGIKFGADVVSVISNISSLRSFSATLHFMDFYDLLLPLAQCCRNLEVLRLKSSTSFAASIPPDSSRLACEVGIISIAQHCNQLHTLYLDQCLLTDVAVQAISSHCPHLKHIGVRGCSHAALVLLAHAYPHLQSLDMRQCNVTDACLQYLANYWHELLSLEVNYNNITARGLAALTRANPHLVHINIGNLKFVSHRTITRLGQSCRQIISLDLRFSAHITDAAVQVIAQCYPHLISLNVSHCYYLTAQSLVVLGEHCHELKVLDISCIGDVTHVGVATLALGCPLLQEFSAMNTEMSDEDVIALVNSCRDLRKLDIGFSFLITLDAISSITQNCPLISHLYLSNCDVDDACLYVIAQHCHNLTYLEILYCNVSRAAVDAVITSCRQLITLRKHPCDSTD